MKLSKSQFIVFSIISVIFILIQAKGLDYLTTGDENVYFYMAKSVAEGQVPYRDFFYAHPPVHLLILAGITKIFGLNFIVLKSAELLALLIASFFLYKTAIFLFRNKLNIQNADSISALALILFLSSFEILLRGTFAMGVNFALMFLMISFYFIFTERYFIGGLFAGLAGMTRFYALPPLIAVFLFVFMKDVLEKKIKNFFIMVLGFLLAFGLPFAFLYLLFDHKFIDPVITYHFLKPKLPNQRMIVYKAAMYQNWPVFLAFLSSLFIKKKKILRLFYLVILAQIGFILLLNVPVEFYFSIAFPFMAIIGGFAILEIFNKLNFSKYFKYLMMALICAVFLWNFAADIIFLEKAGFQELAPLPEMTNVLLKSEPNKLIFGDDSIVPLLALKSNRKIAMNFIDSNGMRFTTGLVFFDFFSDQLNNEDLSYIVLRKGKGIYQIEQFRQYAEKRCKLENQYFDRLEGSFLMYKCG